MARELQVLRIGVTDGALDVVEVRAFLGVVAVDNGANGPMLRLEHHALELVLEIPLERLLGRPVELARIADALPEYEVTRLPWDDKPSD